MFSSATQPDHPPRPPSTSPPTSPSRFGRGLTYLRSYTHHLSPARSDQQSQPSHTDHPSPAANPSSDSPISSNTSPLQPTAATTLPTTIRTGAWLPSQHGPLSALIAAASGRAQVANDPVQNANPITSDIMTRNATSAPDPPVASVAAMPAATPKDASVNPLPSIRFIPHHDVRTSRPSLSFQAISRTLPIGDARIRVGRYSERESLPETNRHLTSASPVGFKSKVVSRRHCEFWCDGGQWFIRDVKSSSGTFLNHLRLSPPGVESKPWPVNDGDVVQLGIDFRGGEEMIFRCVKIRIECNRGWQKAPNPFNKSTHKKLKRFADGAKKRDSDTTSLSSTDCTICLGSISPCQSLFVAPCSHVWHYKCIRTILNGPMWPTFTCPNCRASHDLEAEIEEVESEWEEEEQGVTKQELDAISHAYANAENVPKTAMHPTTTPIRPRQPIDQDGDSPMPDIVSEAPPIQPTVSAPLRPAPPPPPGQESQTKPAPANHPVDRLAETDPTIPSSTSTPPRAIPPRTSARTRQDAPFVNANGNEGPMTPRNDAGPFVLDGGAGTGRTTTNPTIETTSQTNRVRSASHLSLSHESEEVEVRP